MSGKVCSALIVEPHVFRRPHPLPRRPRAAGQGPLCGAACLRQVPLTHVPGRLPSRPAGGPHTGLLHFSAREYGRETGRWTANAPVLFTGGDTNLYGHVLNALEEPLRCE